MAMKRIDVILERSKMMLEAVKNGTYVSPNKRAGAIAKCPDIPPCEYCGRIVYAGICCNKGK